MIRGIVIVGTLLLGVGVVAAQQDLVAQRASLMKANGKNLGTVLSATAKGDKPYDQAAIDAALNVLDNTAKKLGSLYPDATKGLKTDGDFRASPKIWENKAGFEAEIASFAKAVGEAKAKVKDVDSLKASIPAIGKACDSCHEGFRVRS